MSKQNISKGNPGVQPSNGAKGAPNRPANRSAVPPPPSNAKKNGAAARPGYGPAQNAQRQPSARPMRTATGRAAVPAKRKTGFRLRPLDIALVLVGVLVVAFIVLSALHAPVQAIDPNAQLTGNGTPVPMGSAAPDFTLPALDGKTYSLSSFKGKPVVLEFMATWCPHCRDEAPIINQLNAAYSAKGVQILDINATPYDHNYKIIRSEKSRNNGRPPVVPR